MRDRLMREVAALGLSTEPGPEAPVAAPDLAALPGTAQRYLRFMKVLGRPRDWSFALGFKGRFRLGRLKRWMKCETWQYSSRLALARIFHIRVRMAGLVPVLARDTYVAGRGRMRVRLADLVTLADGRGEEFDVGELVTYLNDGIMLAPSMLLVPQVRWSAVDEASFEVAIGHAGRTVSARVFVGKDGAPTDFSTTDRFCSDERDPSKLVRARWTTPIDGWQEIDGRMLFTRGQAVWHLPEVEFAYADFTLDPASVRFNLAPG